MTIKEIYEKFGIPPNLQEHMIRVAKVARFIFDHWAGPILDWDKLEKICLLHDLGNVVKFDLDRYPEFLGQERERELVGGKIYKGKLLKNMVVMIMR